MTGVEGSWYNHAMSVLRTVSLVLALSMVGCPERSAPVAPERISPIIARLESTIGAARENGARDLKSLAREGLTREEAALALRAAARELPPREQKFDDSGIDLVRAVADVADDAQVSVIKALFADYRPVVRVEAMGVVARVKSRFAATTVVELLNNYGTVEQLPELRLQPLQAAPRHGDALFPALLAHLKEPAYAFDLLLLCLSYFEEGALEVRDVSPYVKVALEAYAPRSERLVAKQQPTGIAWMWTKDYEEDRRVAAVLLDLMGHLPDPRVRETLGAALRFDDPRLKYFAAVSLLRQGHPVPPERFKEIASNSEMRGWLYGELQDLGKLELFPKAHASQAALAEANLVNWLVYPTELGRPPDAIELMKVVEQGDTQMYLFRFRTQPPHWAAKDGWMAGVSGPFRKKDGPTTESLGGTFSSFTKWDSKTPGQHVADIEKVLAKWAGQQPR